MTDLQKILEKKIEREKELKKELKEVRKEVKNIKEKIEFYEFKKWKKHMQENGLSIDDLGGLFDDN